MKHIGIIGITGYIGTSVAEYLAQFNGEYHVDRISSRNNNWQLCDFSKYEVVFNATGLCHADAKHGTKEKYTLINTILPVSLAKKAKKEGVRLFINMSSMNVFGNMSRIGENKTITHETIPKPVNIYGLSKLNAEKRLQELEEDGFKVAIIRAPLVYGENAKDNFPKLIRFAIKTPIFPDIENIQSMIYVDNLCELIRLIIDNEQGSIFMPQDSEYVSTSKLVKKVANISGKRLYLTRVFNPIILLFSRWLYILNKIFGNIVYEKSISNYFNGAYCTVSQDQALVKIVKQYKKNNKTRK